MRRTSALLLALTLVAGGCGLFGEEGSGVLVTRRFDIPPDVERVEIADAFTATIRVGTTAPSGSFTVDDNLLDHIRIRVDGDRLTIDVDGRVRNATLRATIGLVTLRSLDLSGASRARVEGELTDDLRIEASGTSDVQIGSADLDELVIGLSGASRMSATGGSAADVRADVGGASHLGLFAIEGEEVELDVSGASGAEVTALDRLEARASGASSVRYRGDPDHVTRDESGSSSVEPA